jgi:hypothetical protein
MKIALAMASVVIGMGLIMPAHAGNMPSSGLKVTQDAGASACYVHKFSGLYKTFKPGDVQAPTFDWRWIHNGDCQCDGKTGDVCQEPGDNG